MKSNFQRDKVILLLIIFFSIFLTAVQSCFKSSSIENDKQINHQNEQISSRATDIVPVIIYADDNYPPYSYTENGKIKGIYPDILSCAVAKLTGYSLIINPIPWKRGLAYLESGKGFGLIPPYYRPQLRPFMDYSVPILDEELVVLYREEIERFIGNSWPEGYYGLRIGINQGFASIPEEIKKKGLLIITESENSRINILNLGKGRIDCYINDKIAMLWVLKKMKENGEYQEGTEYSCLKVGHRISYEQGFLGYTNRDNGEFYFKNDFIARFNAAITEMKANGEIEQIVNNYIK